MITIYVNGSKLSLSDTDFKTAGGEGNIYQKNGIIYKIYQKVVPDSLESKFNELSVLNHSSIIRPINLIKNSKGNLIGYTMSFVDNADALPLLFTTSFRNRHSIDENMNKSLIENFINIIQFIHNKNILIVDLNEYNFLVDNKGYISPYFIDVDSYQTKSFPAKVIMPSIRDYSVSADKFSTLSDWFSFGIIAFQLYTGLHPYKGSHPSYTKGDLESRMRNNVSVFDPNVTYPPIVRSFDLIPDSLREWFFDIFSKGKRLPPPLISSGLAKKISYETVLSNDIISSLIFSTDEPIENHLFIEGTRILFTKNYLYVNQRKYNRKLNSRVINFNGSLYEVWKENNTLILTEIGSMENKLINGEGFGGKLFITHNRLYRFSDDKLYQLEFILLSNNKFNVVVKNSWGVMENSTKVYYNILISELLGTYFFNFPDEDNKCYIIKAPAELQEYKIMDAYYSRGYILIIGFKNGQYDRILIKVEKGYTFIVNIEPDVLIQEINATTNNKEVLLFQEANSLILTNGVGFKKIDNIGDIGVLTSEYEGIYVYKDKNLSLIKMK